MRRVRGGTLPKNELGLMTHLTVPQWIRDLRPDLINVKRLKLESHHGIPKEVQGWIGMTKDVDDCPAYLTTMLEHKGTEVGLHQKIAEKLGAKMDPPRPAWHLNQGPPPGLSNQDILDALEETYRAPDVNLGEFWDVCVLWRTKP